MINRMQYLSAQVPEAFVYTDYYEVEALGVTYIVALSTALALERKLDQCATPDWLEFRDVFGARHRLPARCVYRISESTRETRAAVRAFWQTIRQEVKEDEDPLADLV